MTTLRTSNTNEFRKRVYFDGSPTHVLNDKCLTPLMKACMYGRSEQVKLILEEKPLSVIERDAVFKTALHYCAENDDQDADCAKLLLEVDSSIVDLPDDDGHTALHLAVIAGNLPLVRFLLVSSQADPNKRDAEGHSTVHWATVCADVEALDLVLSHGGTTSSADVHGGYAIHYAAQMCGTGICRSGEVRNVGVCVLQMLLTYGADVNVTDKHGRQPILWAASAGSADAIITLVNGGANIESHDKDGLTALHCAASRGHVDCVDGLLTLCGSEVDSVDSNSCSPLFYAVTLGHADATEILLEHGANPDRQDGKGRTPAHCGAFKGQLETVRLLSEHGANLWLRNLKGGYPLHDAMRSGRKELVIWLISMRPESVDYYDNDGKRPLHIAALNNNLEMSKIILDNGASINPVMKIKGERMTPLDVALRKNNEHLAKFFHLYGGKPASKLNKTISKQSTLRVKTKRSELRRNSHSSDSIGRKFRNDGSRKKQGVRNNGESLKPNKASKGRLVQVHIRADVLTKTIDKARNDKKSCGNTFPKARRRKTNKSVNHEPKECFSENDLCYGDDYNDCHYDYDYEDYDENDDDDDDGDDDDDDDDNVDVDDNDDDDVGEEREQEQESGIGGIEEQTNGSAAIHCNGRRHKNRRRGFDRTTTGQDGGLRNSKKASLSTRRRQASSDKVTKNKQPKSDSSGDTVAGVQQEIVAADRDGDERPNPNTLNEVGRDEQSKTTAEIAGKNSVKFVDEKNDADSRTLVKTVDGVDPRSSVVTARDKTAVSGVAAEQGQDVVPKTDDDRGDALKIANKRGPPTTKRGAPDKIGAEKPSGHEGGKPALVQSKNSDTRAIVEVLDRVDTPQPSSTSATVVGGVGGETTAFSVLPDEGRHDDEKFCECPSCRKKPFRSSSKKMKSRIPRLNNYCSLAPTSDLNTMSVTRAVQLSSRKYHLERLIFYQLSELKRLQIRAGKSDERVLVKRLVEEYGNTGLFTGLKRYDGPFSFKRFEKYLYDQLLVLQRQSLPDGKTVIPRVQSIEEIKKLTGALRRIDTGKTVLENPNDYLSCTQTTNRCFHATHAYTGVPCAAYIPKFRLDHHQMPKPSATDRRRFLPDIRPHDPLGATKCLRNVDPSRPITLQLNNGPCTQAIDLPTDKLDKNKRYFVTFTIKGAGDGSPQDKHRPNPPASSFLHGDNRGQHDTDDCHPPLAHTHAKSF